jgi:hypothetical protein
MIHAFDDREHVAASQAANRLMPAGRPEGGDVVPGLAAARTNAPNRKVGAFLFSGRMSPGSTSLRSAFLQR